MASLTPSHLMILTTLFIVLIFHSKMAMPQSQLMQDICQSSATASPAIVTYDACINALNLDPGSAKANLRNLAKITLKLGQTNTTDSESFIQGLINNKTTEPSLITPLKTCLPLFDAAKNSFRSAFEEVEEDPMTANYDAKIAGDDADQCAQVLSSETAGIPSVTTRINYVKLYSCIGDVITDRLSFLN